MLSFKALLYLVETANEGLEKKVGSDFLSDPLMKTAMYLAYRASYDDVAKKDHEEGIQNSIAQGYSREEAEQQNKFQPPWSLENWIGGYQKRAPAWTFYGRFPSDQDLQIIGEKLKEHNNDIEAVAKDNIQLPNVGGITYKEKDQDSIKLTGLFGWNSRAKMLAIANLTHEANLNNKSILTGADAQLMGMIKRSEPLISKMHQKDPSKIPSPTLGLSTPPPEVIPFLYSIISSSPIATGGGSWDGYNDDGSMNFNLSGIGMRKKFILGNKPLWNKQIGSFIQKAGIDPNMLVQLKHTLADPNSAQIATQMVNKKIQQMMPGSKPLTPSALQWIVNQAA
jgi:hypothetical protein